jgi:hypothetical protein
MSPASTENSAPKRPLDLGDPASRQEFKGK